MHMLTGGRQVTLVAQDGVTAGCPILRLTLIIDGKTMETWDIAGKPGHPPLLTVRHLPGVHHAPPPISREEAHLLHRL